MRLLPLLASLTLLAGCATSPNLCQLSDAAGQSIPQQFTGTLGTIHRPRSFAPPVTLTNLTSASCAGFDRVVFTFSGGLPGYKALYVDKPLRACGSGEPVPVAGDAWLQINLTPAQAHTAAGQSTLPSNRIATNLPNLRELVSTCDFEGHVEWVLGLGSPNRFRITELTNPPRLVVDVKQ